MQVIAITALRVIDPSTIANLSSFFCERSAMSERVTATARLRRILDTDQLVVAPGAYDCIGARMIEQSGFDVCYMTGAGTAASLGYPDYGLLSLTEMADNAARIAAATRLPVIADADTGFGNELNVVRTVRESERRGIAGLHLEDQGFPKKCGHLDEKKVIAADEFITKVRAAADARSDPSFYLIARTDARASHGLQEAIGRANAALAAGADMAFVEAARDLDELAAIPRAVNGPCLLNLVWKGKTPDVSFDEAQAMGYRLAILPGLLFKSAMATFDEVLQQTKEVGRHATIRNELRPQQVFDRLGGREWDGLSKRYAGS
jgi:2-methylisocitrate lyase-like PEP mutase family enzyme